MSPEVGKVYPDLSWVEGLSWSATRAGIGHCSSCGVYKRSASSLSTTDPHHRPLSFHWDHRPLLPWWPNSSLYSTYTASTLHSQRLGRAVHSPPSALLPWQLQRVVHLAPQTEEAVLVGSAVEQSPPGPREHLWQPVQPIWRSLAVPVLLCWASPGHRACRSSSVNSLGMSNGSKRNCCPQDGLPHWDPDANISTSKITLLHMNGIACCAGSKFD